MERNHLLLVALEGNVIGRAFVVVFLCVGGCSALYQDELDAEVRYVRKTTQVYNFPPNAVSIAQEVCTEGPDEIIVVVIARCNTALITLRELGPLVEALSSGDIRKLEFLDLANALASSAAQRSAANDRTWAEAIKFNAEYEYSKAYYDFNDALELTSRLADACDVDRRLRIAAESLLRKAKSGTYPASYRDLAIEVGAGVELAITPHGSLNSYRDAMSYADQRYRRAKLAAMSEPEPVSTASADGAASAQ